MISRRALLAGLAAALPSAAAKPSIGLQTYSLRYDLKKDFPGTIALMRRMGFRELEVSNWPDHSAREYRRLLDDNGLRAVSMMTPYESLDKSLDTVAEDAHALGARFVVCSTLPHKAHMTVEEARHGADFLNHRGEALAKAGLNLCYHIHGTEFHPSPEGTVFDTLMQSVEERFANFEMDIYWVVYGGQDPVTLLHRYPGRFPLTHIKDIKPGMKLGGLPRDVREDESVVLGTGLVDIPAALQASAETGVQQHFIEDEAVDASEQIPKSLAYLESIGWAK
ncbi:MAG: TIM barrel protein [Bryobacterales bacterium]